MAKRVLAHAVDVDGLRAVDVLLHDAAFSMSEVSNDDTRRGVKIPFAAPRKRDLSRRARREGPRTVPGLTGRTSRWLPPVEVFSVDHVWRGRTNKTTNQWRQ